MKSSSRWMAPVIIIFLVVGAVYFLWPRGGSGPSPSSPQYKELVSAFYVGLGALESGEGRAAAKFQRVTELAPDEPAGWANLALLQLRNNELDAAAQNAEKARVLAPQNAAIESLLGLIESRRANSAAAIEHLKKAAQLDKNDLKVLYALAQEIERQNTPESIKEAAKVFDEILQKAPENLVAHLERARLAAKGGETQELQKQVDWLQKQQANWQEVGREQFAQLKAAKVPQDATVRVVFLSNVLKPEERYQNDIAALAPPPNQLGEPITRFLSMPSPPGVPAPPDMQITFTPQPIEATGQWKQATVYMADGETPPDAILLRENEWRLAADGKASPFPGSPGAALPLDWDYDFKSDLALAGSKGFRLLRANEKGFTDVTAQTKLPPQIINGKFNGAWAADTEMDGDLDIVLSGASQTLVLRNNGDGTFKVQTPFGNLGAVKEFLWADVDDDGDPDALLLGADALRLFLNERSGAFKESPGPEVKSVTNIAVADINRDGLMDIVTYGLDGILRRCTIKAGTGWDVQEIATGGPAGFNGPSHLCIADLDNNGALDAIVSTGTQARIYLGAEKEVFAPLDKPLDFAIPGASDINKDGLLDLLALDKKGAVQWLLNKSTKTYHWLALRPLAQAGNVTGDGRINSFGIGGEIAVRSGLLYQKQVIQAPVVHFGLGEQEIAEIARITWPNGDTRAEFDLKGNQSLSAIQRLTGSCPFLFTWDGTKMVFVTDCIWRSPLGLKINAQDTAGSMQTLDWVKIRGDQLQPRNGLLDLSVTAELWETHFFDHLGLMSVDHPAGTEIWVDERLAFPQPPLKVYATQPAMPVRATDDGGRDVSDVVKARDGKYLDNFGRGKYQGITRDHWVEIEVPEAAPQDGPLYLVAHGWIHPTDSSINVAIGQGSSPPPQGLRLEVPDASGKWVVARPGLGFPEGKLKTVVIRLDDSFKPGAPRRARLHTNLEIYWDSLAVAVGAPEAPLKTQRLTMASGDLQYRGFSEVKAADASSPELPLSYEKLATTNQQWRDLIGFHTRFGDVRPLLKGIDDRYVIMNAGDEMKLSFQAPAPPPPGWVRDWVLIGDGWVKDGNLNTTWSKTVIPLPSHDLPQYDTPPRDLWNDPVYLRHKEDWQTYHTRYVTPRGFQNALRPAPVGAN